MDSVSMSNPKAGALNFSNLTWTVTLVLASSLRRLDKPSSRAFFHGPIKTSPAGPKPVSIWILQFDNRIQPFNSKALPDFGNIQYRYTPCKKEVKKYQAYFSVSPAGARTLKIGLEKDDEQGCLAGLSVCLVSVFRFAACGECVSCKCKIGGFG